MASVVSTTRRVRARVDDRGEGVAGCGAGESPPRRGWCIQPPELGFLGSVDRYGSAAMLTLTTSAFLTLDLWDGFGHITVQR